MFLYVCNIYTYECSYVCICKNKVALMSALLIYMYVCIYFIAYCRRFPFIANNTHTHACIYTHLLKIMLLPLQVGYPHVGCAVIHMPYMGIVGCVELVRTWFHLPSSL